MSSVQSDMSAPSTEKVPRKRGKRNTGTVNKANKPTSTSTSGKPESAEQASLGPARDSPAPAEPNGDAREAESESELSEVLDEAPPKQKKKKGGTASGKATKEKKPVRGKAKADADMDPQDAEIKRLQSWLLKCGIRKMWHRELAPFQSPKAKINHLRGMLKDAGMDGRYSIEKANRIKEERELKAELEAVQEGAKHWGQSSGSEDKDEDEDEGVGKKPRRRLAKGLKELDFLGDDDGEETD